MTRDIDQVIRSNLFEPVQTTANGSLCRPLSSDRECGRHDNLEHSVEIFCNELALRWPHLRFQARRVAVVDPRVRSICEDYTEAVSAAVVAECRDPPNFEKADEFRQMASELLDEARVYIEAHVDTTDQPKTK